METLCPSSYSLFLPALGNHYSTFCLCECDYSRFLRWVELYRICLFLNSLHKIFSRVIHVVPCIRVLLIFIMAKYTQQNSYHFNHSQVYNSVALNAFTALCNHHHYYSLNFFINFHINSVPIKHKFFLLPVPGGYHFIFCLYEFSHSRYLIFEESYNISLIYF